MQRLFAPGLEGTNIVLKPDPEAMTRMEGGYRWSGIAPASAGSKGQSKVLRWAIAVAVVVGVLCAAVAGGCVLAAWRRKQRMHQEQQKAAEAPCPHCQEEPCICSEARHTVMPLNQHISQEFVGDLDGRVVVPHRIAGDAPGAHQALFPLDGLNEATRHQGPSVKACQRSADVAQLTSSSGSSQSGGTGASAGLNNWWRAVSSTTLTLMQRRMDVGESAAEKAGPSEGSGDEQQPVGVLSLQDAAGAGGLLPLAAPGRPAAAAVLETVLGQVSAKLKKCSMSVDLLQCAITAGQYMRRC